MAWFESKSRMPHCSDTDKMKNRAVYFHRFQHQLLLSKGITQQWQLVHASRRLFAASLRVSVAKRNL
jgi:hypothetical protein